ncbi:unnamed protein product [Owenia fusiformis]|uniref:Crossover junction endonuclease MUS81 n=1 Tax=Owenia fusiformis TaxID=6347 RepID=A0A8J1YAC4_OWEFU|nr:unnamed protein product [Owenia fusiformis]
MRIFIRNKSRYSPEFQEDDMMYIDVQDYAGTTINELKEHCKRKSPAKIDELFYRNEALADDRSVAHNNLHDNVILETTSNPFFLACMNILLVKAERNMSDYPDKSPEYSRFKRSKIHKITIIGVLTNSKKESDRQPPHMSNVNAFIAYIDRLGKKGASMSYFTRDALHEFYEEFEQLDMQKPDPVGSFLRRHAIQLGFIDPKDGDDVGGAVVHNGPGHTAELNHQHDINVINPNNRAGKIKNNKAGVTPTTRRVKAIKDRPCEDCGEDGKVAVIYCPDCEGGLALCQDCSDLTHRGAARRHHQLKGILEAPKVHKPYSPKAYRTPFALLIGLHSGLHSDPPMLSMNERNVKDLSQPHTDTDLDSKNPGKFFGGFDSMENTLIMKNLVLKEAAINPSYALTVSGRHLAEKCSDFAQAYYNFSSVRGIPKIPEASSTQIGAERLCLVIDSQEKERERLIGFARQRGIVTKVRELPAGDYVWLLLPPGADGSQDIPSNREMMLPYIVERKSWDDLFDSMRTSRFDKQIVKMQRCGLKNIFYLLEGSINDTKSKLTDEKKTQIKTRIQKLQFEEDIFVNYTASWLKTVQWLVQITSLIADAYRSGMDTHDRLMSYAEFCERVQHGDKRHRDRRPREYHTWPAGFFVDLLFRDNHGGGAMMQTVKTELGIQGKYGPRKHLLVIQGLEDYNKCRQRYIDKALSDFSNNKGGSVVDIVNDQLGPLVADLVHYDVTSFWQLHIQVCVGVVIQRTEKPQEATDIQEQFMQGPGDHPDDHMPRQQNLNNYVRPPPTPQSAANSTQPVKPASRHKSPTLPTQAPQVHTLPSTSNATITTADIGQIQGVQESLNNTVEIQGGQESQDDDLRKAIELSLRQSQNSCNVRADGLGPVSSNSANKYSANASEAKGATDEGQLSEEEQLKRVLELSRIETAMNSDLVNDSDYASKLDRGHVTNAKAIYKDEARPTPCKTLDRNENHVPYRGTTYYTDEVLISKAPGARTTTKPTAVDEEEEEIFRRALESLDKPKIKEEPVETTTTAEPIGANNDVEFKKALEVSLLESQIKNEPIDSSEQSCHPVRPQQRLSNIVHNRMDITSDHLKSNPSASNVHVIKEEKMDNAHPEDDDLKKALQLSLIESQFEKDPIIAQQYSPVCSSIDTRSGDSYEPILNKELFSISDDPNVQHDLEKSFHEDENKVAKKGGNSKKRPSPDSEPHAPTKIQKLYDTPIQNLSEEEQFRLAMEESMKEPVPKTQLYKSDIHAPPNAPKSRAQGVLSDEEYARKLQEELNQTSPNNNADKDAILARRLSLSQDPVQYKQYIEDAKLAVKLEAGDIDIIDVPVDTFGPPGARAFSTPSKATSRRKATVMKQPSRTALGSPIVHVPDTDSQLAEYRRLQQMKHSGKTANISGHPSPRSPHVNGPHTPKGAKSVPTATYTPMSKQVSSSSTSTYIPTADRSIKQHGRIQPGTPNLAKQLTGVVPQAVVSPRVHSNPAVTHRPASHTQHVADQHIVHPFNNTPIIPNPDLTLTNNPLSSKHDTITKEFPNPKLASGVNQGTVAQVHGENTDQGFASSPCKYQAEVKGHQGVKVKDEVVIIDSDSDDDLPPSGVVKPGSFNPKVGTKQGGTFTHGAEPHQSNIKCGNCGRLGHTRTSSRCPHYYSQEEHDRREAKKAKAREKREAAEREDQRLLDNLQRKHDRTQELIEQQEREKRLKQQQALNAVNAVFETQIEPVVAQNQEYEAMIAALENKQRKNARKKK